jgi:LmbE family N-acetylglucosaminyl deacetylase
MRVLWIGAHPDDELFVAPWLGFLLKTEQAELGFLVATRGERGTCLLPEGCEAELATIREQEMLASARIFRGRVWFADCPDGRASEPEDVLSAWARDAGGMDALETRFRSIIEEFAPDRIVTFNRRHGCSWHADHRAVGLLVQSLALPIPITLAESRLTFDLPFRVEPGVSGAVKFDARETWNYLVGVLRCHPSQISPQTVDLFDHVPEEQRTVFLRHRERFHRWSRPLDDVRIAIRRAIAPSRLFRSHTRHNGTSRRENLHDLNGSSER